MEYENVVFVATEGRVEIFVETPEATVGTQISALTGIVTGGSNVPKAPPKD